MDTFEALVTSLGEHSVDYIGREYLRSLSIFADQVEMVADVQICLTDNGWESQSRAVDKMIELRGMFIDDLSVSYRFVEEDSDSAEAAKRSTYAYA